MLRTGTKALVACTEYDLLLSGGPDLCCMCVGGGGRGREKGRERETERGRERLQSLYTHYSLPVIPDMNQLCIVSEYN